MPQPGLPDPLEAAVREHQMRQHAESVMQQQLQATLNSPMELRTFGPNLMALRVDPGPQGERLVLAIALPSGVRMDFVVSEKFIAELAKRHRPEGDAPSQPD